MRTSVSRLPGEVQMYAVYAPDRNGRPVCWVTVADARWLTDCGAAVWVTRRGTALRLLKAKEEIRGISTKMKWNFCMRVAEHAEQHWAKAILEFWNGSLNGWLFSPSGRNGRIASDSRALARSVPHLSAGS